MQFTEEIKDLVKNNKTEESIQKLHELIKQKHLDLEDEVIQISAKMNDLMSSYQRGLLSNSEFFIEKAKINEVILSVIRKIENPIKFDTKKRNFRVAFFAFLTLVGMLFIVAIIIYKNNNMTAQITQPFSPKHENNSEFFNHKITINEIKKIAKKHGLLNITGINAHLSFSEGDFEYWYNQISLKGDLEVCFSARRKILDKATKEGRIIENQGDLANEAEILIIQEIAEKYNLTTPGKINPHLVLDSGDFSYWKDTKKTFSEIEIRFKIMRQIIDEAESMNKKIKSKGDLGFFTEEKIKRYN